MVASLIKAHEQGYVEARDNADDRFIAKLWAISCREDHRPYVRVTPRNTRGAVLLDMETSGRRLNADGKVAIKQAITAHRGGALGVYCYGNTTRVSGLYLDDCHALAKALLEIVKNEDYLEGVNDETTH